MKLLDSRGNGQKVVFLLTSEQNTDACAAISALVTGDYTLAALGVSDWNRDYSPWRAAGLTDGEVFEGGGRETLKELLTIADGFAGSRPAYLCGYSLAGLFALWSCFETRRFSGCACCSGSLWFEGFESYANERKLPTGFPVYLSLGGREERAPNPIMATIGDKTRRMDRLLAEKGALHKLEMNPGGHFADPYKRMAKGIKWIQEQA